MKYSQEPHFFFRKDDKCEGNGKSKMRRRISELFVQPRERTGTEKVH